MKTGRFYLLFVFVIVGMMACRAPITSESSLTEYLNNSKNGLKKTQEVNKIKLEATYLPWQAIAARLRLHDTLSLARLKSKCYFVLGLSANNKELLRQLPYNEYSEMVQVLAFRMRPYISIITDDGKRTDAEDCVFQQTYGMGKENELLLVFDRNKLKNTSRLDLKIKEFGLNTGNQDFQFQQKDIDNVPPIKII